MTSTIPQPRPKSQTARRLTATLIVAAFASLFWGKLWLELPGPASELWRICQGRIRPLWPDQPWTWLAIHTSIGLVVPAVAIKIASRSILNAGLGFPNRIGRCWTMVGVLISLPIGALLLFTAENGGNTIVFDSAYLCAMLVFIPEHFLIFGVVLSLWYDRGCWPARTSRDKDIRTGLRHPLQLLGLGASEGNESTNRILAWLGIGREDVLPILLSGLLFGLVHFGKGTPELLVSFPGGVVTAYITLRSRSIGPMVIAHWSLNIVPQLCATFA